MAAATVAATVQMVQHNAEGSVMTFTMSNIVRCGRDIRSIQLSFVLRPRLSFLRFLELPAGSLQSFNLASR